MLLECGYISSVSYYVRSLFDLYIILVIVEVNIILMVENKFHGKNVILKVRSLDILMNLNS